MIGIKKFVGSSPYVGLAAVLAGCGVTSTSANDEPDLPMAIVDDASVDVDTAVGSEHPAILLLVEPGQSGFHLVRPGELPSMDTLVELPVGFRPAKPTSENSPFRADYLQTRNEAGWGFTENGQFLIGTARVDDSYQLVIVEVSSGKQTTALEGTDELTVYLTGNQVIVIAERGESDHYLLFDPSLPDSPTVLGPAEDIQFSVDGRFIVLTEKGDMTVLEIPEGRRVLKTEAIKLQFAPDGRHLAVASDSGVSIYGLPSGELTASEPGFEASQTWLAWNSGDALVAFDYFREPVLFPMNGNIVALPFGFDSAHFISPSSRDLFLGDERRDMTPSYFVAESEEIIPLHDLRPFDTNGMFGFLAILDPITEGYSELLNIGSAGNQVNRLTSQGLEEVLVASPGLVPYQAVRAGDTNYFLFFSEDDKGERKELYSERGGVITQIYSGAGSSADFVWKANQLFLNTDVEGENDDYAILALSHSDAREVSRAVFDFAAVSSDLSEDLKEIYRANYYLLAVHEGSR